MGGMGSMGWEIWEIWGYGDTVYLSSRYGDTVYLSIAVSFVYDSYPPPHEGTAIGASYGTHG